MSTVEMSASAVATSTGIVVVDNSNVADNGNLLNQENIVATNIHHPSSTSHILHHPQLQTHQQSVTAVAGTTQTIQTQQVIINEQFLNNDGTGIVTAGDANYITTSDFLNNAQIINIISGEQAALLEHQQQQQQLHDDSNQSQVAQIQAIAANPKVHVISNVTLVSKAQQLSNHQSKTISFVNSKLPAGATYVNTYMKAGTLPQTGKIVTIPYSSSNTVGHQQQTQQHQIITKHLSSVGGGNATTGVGPGGPVMQKVQLAQRNIQVVTRMPNMAPHSVSSASATTLSTNQNSNNNILRVSPPVIQNQLQHQRLLQPQQHSQSNAVFVAKPTTMNAIKNKGHMGGKTAGNLIVQQMKPMKMTTTGQKFGGQTRKVSKQQYNNTSVGTITYQQQQANVHKTMLVQSQINNNTKMMNNQQRNLMNNVNIATSNQTALQKVAKTNNNNHKIMVQSNPLSQIVVQSTPQNMQLQKFSNIQQPQLIATQQQQQFQNVQSIGNSSGIPNSGNIKYVNAQGNVIASPNRYRTIIQQQSNQNQMQQQTITMPLQTKSKIKANSNETQHIGIGSTVVMPSSPLTNELSSRTAPNSIDDIVIVNGTHMNEEMSARILQSFSQRHYTKPHPQLQQQQYQFQQTAQQFVKQSIPQAQQSNQQSQQVFIASIPNSQPNYQQIQRSQQPVQQSQQQPVYVQANRPVRGVLLSQQSIMSTTNAIATETSSVGGKNETKFGPEFFQVSTSDIQSHTTNVIDHIPLISTRNPELAATVAIPRQMLLHQHLHQDQDEDVIGEEVRPEPVNSMDLRLQAVHAMRQDHTYALPITKGVCDSPVTHTPITSASSTTTSSLSCFTISGVPSTQEFTSVGQQVQQKIIQPESSMRTLTNVTMNSGITSGQITASQILIKPSPQPQPQQPQVPQSHPSPPVVQQYTQQLQAQQHVHIPVVQSSIQQTQQHHNQAHHQFIIQTLPQHLSTQPQLPGHQQQSFMTYDYNPNRNKDDDANSVISNNSRSGNLDNGEETDTALEGEGEDDSVTRCICDLTHDDGYMICCDKCSAWQHVDCMGIDRQNIPDEYKCEVCQPRNVDKTRARTLQLMKRKEQQNFILLNTTPPDQLTTSDSGTGLLGNQQLNNLTTMHNKKGRPFGTKRRNELYQSKKKSRLATDGGALRANGKRKESKKLSKRKSLKGANDSSEKQAANLRQWIENYELAMTNHYSPELRARLTAISKQHPSQTSAAIDFLSNIGSFDGKCTTVPHAGGKILISTMDICPSLAVIEIRGKYMLSGQYRAQHANLPASNARNNARQPGPFIFFYRLPNDGPEICVDTRTYGNEARFVRRSCRPNSEIMHTIEKGTIHLYIVTLITVRSSTEITIRHEPNDLAALARGTLTAPTSSMCACGLTKDCVFSAVVATTSIPPIISAPPLYVPALKHPKRLNGHLMGDKPNRRNKNTAARGRSTSSSGESTAGLISPSQVVIYVNSIPTPATLVSSVMHDSGICTSSSSPPVSLPSPTPVMLLATPQESPLCDNIPDQVQPCAQILTIPTVQPLFSPPDQKQSLIQLIETFDAIKNVTQDTIKPEIKHEKEEQPLPTSHNVENIEIKNDLAESSISVEQQTQMMLQESVVSAFMVVPQSKSPVRPTSLSFSEPVSIKVEVKDETKDENIHLHPNMLQTITSLCEPRTQDQTPIMETNITPITPLVDSGAMKSPPCHKPYGSAGKRTPRKSSCSLSEDSLAGDDSTRKEKEYKESNKGSTEPAKSNKKLTREERKMEAIVRAFEKMEKNAQRKQELKQNKTTGVTSGGHGKSRQSNSPTPKQISKRDSNETPHKKSGSLPRKKKRKASKSYHQMYIQRKRRRSRLNSGDSDAMTSEDSTSLLSPPIPATVHIPINDFDEPKESILQSPTQLDRFSGNITEKPINYSNDVGLLMALSQSTNQNIANSPTRSDGHFEPTIPPFISPACMLVEAAVAPLEQGGSHSVYGNDGEFKHPPKTKKTIMNEWLHQAVQNHEHDPIAALYRQQQMQLQQQQQKQQLQQQQQTEQEHQQYEQHQQHQQEQQQHQQIQQEQQELQQLQQQHQQHHHPGKQQHQQQEQVHEQEKQQQQQHQEQQQEQQQQQQEHEHQQLQIQQQQQQQQHQVKQEQHIILLQQQQQRQEEEEEHLRQQQIYEDAIQQQQQQEDEDQHYIQQKQQQQSNEQKYYVVDQQYDRQPEIPYQIEPQNLSMAAKKIVEFINLSSDNYEEVALIDKSISVSYSQPLHGNEQIPLTNDIPPQYTVALAMPTPPMKCGGGSSSVKKRWLRQAISEECSDEMVLAQNGYSTPLKKRRMARQCSDMPDCVSSPSLPSTPTEQSGIDIVSNQEQYAMESVVEEMHDDSPNLIENFGIKPIQPVGYFSNIVTDDQGMERSKEQIRCSLIDDENRQTVETEEIKHVMCDQQQDHTFTSVDGDNNIQLALNAREYLENQIPDTRKTVDITCDDESLQKTMESETVEVQVESKDQCQNYEITSKYVHTEKQCDHQILGDTPSYSGECADRPIDGKVLEEEDLRNSRVELSKDNIEEDEFDIKPLEKEDDPMEAIAQSCAVGTTNIDGQSLPLTSPGLNDEIADIQKRVHSFLSETLMQLKTRNKMKVSRASSPSRSSDSGTYDSPTKSEESVDKIRENPEEETGSAQSELFVRQYEKPINEIVPSAMSAATIPNFNRNLYEGPYSAYLLNSVPDVPPGPPPLAKLSNQLPCTYGVHLPIIGSGTSQYLNPVPSLHHSATRIDLSQTNQANQTSQTNPLLTSIYNATAFSELNMSSVPQPVPPPLLPASSSLGCLDNNEITTTRNTLGYVSIMDSRPHTLFVNNLKSSIASSLLGIKSYSTLDTSTNNISASSAVAATVTGKVYTRTQSSDPRLNPALTVPEPPPVPKRKLSINEYRKRKQLTSESDKQSVKDDHLLTNSLALEFSSADNSSSTNVRDNGLILTRPSTVKKESVFSPAPTLLELQQESMFLRRGTDKVLNVAAINTESTSDSCGTTPPTMLVNSTSDETSNKYGSNNSLASISSVASENIVLTPTVSRCQTPEPEETNIGNVSKHTSKTVSN